MLGNFVQPNLNIDNLYHYFDELKGKLRMSIQPFLLL